MQGSAFTAPWGKSLALTTSLVAFVLSLVSLVGLVAVPSPPFARFVMIGLPLLILMGCAASAVRGYVIMGPNLLVKRLFWSSRLDLSALISAARDPGAMDHSIRTFGNGGVFAVSGWFRNQRLGSYRAFATDPILSVVLRLPTGVIVVTPGSPEEFVARVLAATRRVESADAQSA